MVKLILFPDALHVPVFSTSVDSIVYFTVVVTGFEEATVTTLEGSTEFAVCFVKNLTVDSFTFEIAALDGTAVDLIGTYDTGCCSLGEVTVDAGI